MKGYHGWGKFKVQVFPAVIDDLELGFLVTIHR